MSCLCSLHILHSHHYRSRISFINQSIYIKIATTVYAVIATFPIVLIINMRFVVRWYRGNITQVRHKSEVNAASHNTNVHRSKTLNFALMHINQRQFSIKVKSRRRWKILISSIHRTFCREVIEMDESLQWILYVRSLLIHVRNQVRV